MIGSSLVLQGSVHCMEILPMSYMGVYKDTSIWSDTSMGAYKDTSMWSDTSI